MPGHGARALSAHASPVSDTASQSSVLSACLSAHPAAQPGTVVHPLLFYPFVICSFCCRARGGRRANMVRINLLSALLAVATITRAAEELKAPEVVPGAYIVEYEDDMVS